MMIGPSTIDQLYSTKTLFPSPLANSRVIRDKQAQTYSEYCEEDIKLNRTGVVKFITNYCT